MSVQVTFSKPPTTPEKQVALLRSRGMTTHSEERAREFLTKVNYYRFCGYALHFEIFENRVRTHRYKQGTTFDSVIALHTFDSRLRTLLFSFIEPIEIAFRTAICLQLSLRYGDPHWYTNRSMYDPARFGFDAFIADCRAEYMRSREVFIQYYRRKYSQPELPPIWMMTEILSLGKWSKVFGGIGSIDDQKAIAKGFGVSPWHLKSWMHALSFLRNLCAHHARIWNRTFPILPNLTDRQKECIRYHDRIAGFCTVMADLLGALDLKHKFADEFCNLLDESPTVPVAKLGLTDNWRRCSIWK